MELLIQEMARLAPAGASISAEAVGDAEGLLAEELELLGSAVWKRRIEFAAGRRSARKAMAAIGGPHAPILRGCYLEPLWPSGYGGSISHDGAVAGALVCRCAPGLSPYGLDLVDLRAHPEQEFEEIAAAIVKKEERLYLNSGENTMATVFSVKEAAIKILSPRERRFVDFKSICIAGSSGETWFLLSDSGVGIEVRSVAIGGLLVSVASVSRE